MKKRGVLCGIGMLAVLALAGCGKKASDQYLLDETYADYVTLCDYKGVKAQKVSYSVSEKDIREAVEETLSEYAELEDVNDRSAQEGDTVNIDYEVKIDGKVSEDYSGSGEETVIGDGEILPEIEGALVGMKGGEKKTVDAVLTEDFADDEDVGKKVSAEVTLHGISKEVLPEYTAEFVKENLEFDSIEAYEASVRDNLMAEKEEEYRSVTLTQIMDYMVEHSTFDGYPKSLYEKCEKEYDEENEETAAMWGMETSDYLEFFGITEEDRKKEIESMVNQELVVGAIIQKEDFKCTEEDIKEFVDGIYQEYEYDSAKEFREDYGDEEIGTAILYERVMNLLYDNAVLEEISEEEYLASQEDEEDAEPEDEEEVSADEEDAGTDGKEVEANEKDEGTDVSADKEDGSDDGEDAGAEGKALEADEKDE